MSFSVYNIQSKYTNRNIFLIFFFLKDGKKIGDYDQDTTDVVDQLKQTDTRD